MFKNKLIVAPVILAAICLTGCGTTNNETYSNTSVPAIVYETSTTETSATETSTTETPSSKPVSSSSTTVESKPVESTSDTASDSDDVSTFDISKLQINIDSSKPESSKPESSKPESSKPESSKPESSKPESSKPDVDINAADMASASSISKICGLKSEVELKIESCIVDVFNDHNPYDVEYDYGKTYDKYVEACNWNLVFDADYYIAEFPLLAMQYNYDKKLLLEHFQTIGIHEGRQGNKSFNVGAYKSNCASDVRNTFGDNYEGYYFYYMLNYATEKSVRTTDGSATQYKTIMTALQAAELEGINDYRDDVNVSNVKFNSELAAFANYRAYINAHNYYNAHDWAKQHNDVLINVMNLFSAKYIAENTCQSNCADNYGRIHATCYLSSRPHYEAMVNSRFNLTGISNSYQRQDFTCQFDMYLDL